MFGGTIGTPELLVILVLVLLLFGAKKIPEIMRGFGEGLREFKSASQRAMSEIDDATRVAPTPAPTPTPTSASTTAAPANPQDAPKVDPS